MSFFFCGTAVEITPIKSVDRVKIGAGKRGKVTELIQSTYLKTVRGEDSKYADWLDRV